MATVDAVKNFAKVTVSTGYDAAATSVVLAAGNGAELPTVPFNATWWNATDYGDPSDDPNVEIVRVTARATDTLTVTRAQEATAASTKNTAGKTYLMVAGITAKTIADLSSLALSVGGVILTGVRYVNPYGGHLPSTHNDLYTPPAGKAALVIGMIAYNDSGSNVSVFSEIKNGGTYYQRSVATTVSSNASSSSMGVGVVLTSSDTFAVNVGTLNVLNIQGIILEFDVACGLKSAKLLSLSVGNNTLYTCPAGKTAVLLPSAGVIAASNAGGTLCYHNFSGGTRTITYNAVPSGGSPTTSNQITTSASVTDATISTLGSVSLALGPGDFISINTDAATATQWCFVNVLEIG